MPSFLCGQYDLEGAITLSMAATNCCFSPTFQILLIALILFSLSSAGGQSTSNTAPSPSPSDFPQPSDFPNVKQYLAYRVIQRFKQSITCDPNNVTTTWSGFLPCTYRGFFCETPPGLLNTPTIASIDFNGFRLCAPTLSGFLDALPDLALFHANSNNFSGVVPNLSSLRFLYELDLSNNDHSGTFPSAILPLSQLTFLDLRFNRFVGAIPPSAFTLAAATADALFLNNNLFSQQLPADIGRSTAAFLVLANNAFTGPIPRSIGNLSNTLVEVLFLNNRLSGCLPFEIGLLKRLTVFDAGFNRITGPMPYSLGCLINVEQLNFAGNLLYGEVPEVVCRLAEFGKLENLSLSNNYFSWMGHSCWRLIASGVLDVRRNCIFGLPEQRPAVECAFFWAHFKFCPLFMYMPCRQPIWKNKMAMANSSGTLAAAEEEEEEEEEPYYRSYSALKKPDGN